MIAIALAALLAQDPAAGVLERSCAECHNPKRRKGGLDLTTRAALLEGGQSGAAVVPGNAAKSFLMKLASHELEPAMPHRKAKLPAADLAALGKWIDAGATYERPLRWEKADQVHWAFRPLVRPRGNSVDRFLRPGAAADDRTLVRRATFGLVGLPPSPEEVEAFAREPDLEKLVERLLASPHFGERWGRHWLDVARYADSSGYESDTDRPNAWPYRDFVIRAMNDDLPFDAFVRWQVAGDELAPEEPQAVAATGFCTAGPNVRTLPTDMKRNRERYRYDELDDIVSTALQAFLGLTVGCARCHDHKYDPIPTKDYYRLAAVFSPSERVERPLSAPHRKLEEWLEARRAELREEKLAALGLTEEEKVLLRVPVDGNIVSSKRLHERHGKAVQAGDEEFRAWLGEERRAELGALEAAAGAVPRAPRALVLANRPGPEEKDWWLRRGEPDLKGGEIEPGFLGALARKPPEIRPGARRTALAAWLTDVEGGAGALLARVIVNRLWQHHFGEGLVRTPNDFGTQGEPPDHPELLEWLASELVARGWRLKEIHRLILSSAAWRAARRPVRLEAEVLRDSMLALSGRLDRTMFGPAVRIPIPKEAMVTRTKDPYPAVKDGPGSWRRTVYVFVKRSVMAPFLETFDGPNAGASCGRRERTTVAPQALALLNDPFVRACAADFARRAGDRRKAFLMALGRAPRGPELAAALRLDLVDFCHVLFTLNEFAYVD
jgi:hypothetical protein